MAMILHKVSHFRLVGHDFDGDEIERVFHNHVQSVVISDADGDALLIAKGDPDLAECEKYFKHEPNPVKCDRFFPQTGEVWKHFKGKTVRILAISRDSEFPSLQCVVYECSNGVYHRPLDMFMSEVDREKYPDVEQKYRFERLN